MSNEDQSMCLIHSISSHLGAKDMKPWGIFMARVPNFHKQNWNVKLIYMPQLELHGHYTMLLQVDSNLTAYHICNDLNTSPY